MAKSVDADSKKNTYDPKRVETLVRKIEDEFDGLLSERMSYMSKCKPYRERIAMAYEEGIGFDIPKKILKAKIKERALQRQIDGIPDDFEEDDREAFENLSQALGEYADTPLGKGAAAMHIDQTEAGKKKKKAPSSAGDDDADLRGNSQKLAEKGREEEAARVAAENADKLVKGISQLN